jgi:hypothetical protein
LSVEGLSVEWVSGWVVREWAVSVVVEWEVSEWSGGECDDWVVSDRWWVSGGVNGEIVVSECWVSEWQREWINGWWGSCEWGGGLVWRSWESEWSRWVNNRWIIIGSERLNTWMTAEVNKTLVVVTRVAKWMRMQVRNWVKKWR